MDRARRTAVRIRPKARAATAHRTAVFTSVDGTLLDPHTFDPGPAREAVRRLASVGIPVVPVTVMTLDEIAPVASELGLRHAMIVEAGGAIARWNGSGWELEPCGPAAETLLEVVRDIEDRSGASLLVYSAVAEREASHLSGRTGEMLSASRQRCFSEPFVLESGDLERVCAAAEDIGFSVRRGRRFLHLCRACDQGEAFIRLRDELQCELAIALGGAPVDAEFMSRADVAIIVPGPDGNADRELVEALPHARVAPASGPAGWSAAVAALSQPTTAQRRRAGRR